jgi:cell division septation protein DedD
MVLDYSERKPVSKNRPRKQPAGIFIFILVGAVVTSFAAGLLSGWLFFRPSGTKQAARQQLATAPNQNANGASLPPTQAQPSGQEVPLTFYQTLPHGGKAVIGSGLNPKKYDDSGAKKPVNQPLSQVQPPRKTEASPVEARPDEHSDRSVQPVDAAKHAAPKEDKESTVKKHPPVNATFSVQAVSSRDKRDAEAIKNRLEAKGLAAYIVESKLADRGVWYRVRLGRHLDQSEANELAAKAGKGAIVIPE